jgi:glycosyltransferase involved in cell wall biosynthesis
MELESIYLSIVVPLFNEEENIGKLVLEIVEAGKNSHFDFEVILVDDGSTDKTWQKIVQLKREIPNLRAIKFRRNHGQTSAMVAGIDYSRGDIVVTMDGDLQNDPRDISSLVQKIDEGYDVVCGWRKNRKDKTITRIIPSKIANWLIAKITGVSIHDNGCSLKAYRNQIIKSVRLYSDMHRFIPAMTTIVGARVTEIVVNHRPRKYGVSKYGLSRIWKVLSDMITIKMLIHFHNRPFLWFAGPGIFFFLCGIAFGVASISNFVNNQGTIIIISASFLFFTLSGGFLSWGLLAEYFVKVHSRSHFSNTVFLHSKTAD